LKSTNYESPHYVVFSSLKLLPPSYVQILCPNILLSTLSKTLMVTVTFAGLGLITCWVRCSEMSHRIAIKLQYSHCKWCSWHFL